MVSAENSLLGLSTETYSQLHVVSSIKLRYFVGAPKCRAASDTSKSSIEGEFTVSAEIQVTSGRDKQRLLFGLRVAIFLRGGPGRNRLDEEDLSDEVDEVDSGGGTHSSAFPCS